DIYIPDAQLWQLYQDENDSVSVRMIALLPQAVVDDDEIETTEELIQTYYEEHRDDYLRPATAYLSYVTTSRVPNATDSSAALQRTQMVLDELRGGADFAEVATRESADSASRMNGGDLGEASRGQHVTIFAEAALALNPGELSEPVLTTYGYHIIKLHSKSGDTYHASHILIPVELDGDHLIEVESRGDSLDLYGAEQADPTVLDSLAVSMGLELTAANPLVEGGRLRVGLDLVPDVGVWAFEALEGETSHVIESDAAFYLFRLDSIVPEGVTPFEEVRERVTFEAAQELKWAKAEELAAAIHTDLNAGDTWDEVADRHGLRSVETPLFTRLVPNPALYEAPAVVGAAFGLEIGQHSGPIHSEQAIFFIQPVTRQLADSAAFAAEIDAYRERALNAAQQSRVQMALAAIRQLGEVEDLRREVAQALRNVPQDLFPGNPLGF
ncbi:MAG: peptidyl-prolyl cis-trans isomerase, partial [Gemmatimonadota bacterium]